MPIEHWGNGGLTITGASIDYARICTLKAAVGLEIKGIRVRRGRLVWPQVKKEFNIKGGRADVLKWLEAKVAELAPQQEHIHGQ